MQQPTVWNFQVYLPICDLVKTGYYYVIAFHFFPVNREMKGMECRINLIKLTNVLCEHQDTSTGREIYQLLISLVELQKIAYSEESERAPRSILRACNQSFAFAMPHIKLFNNPQKVNYRKMFGVPFYALSVHLAETCRIINGRSIVAEAAERHFNKLR